MSDVFGDDFGFGPPPGRATAPGRAAPQAPPPEHAPIPVSLAPLRPVALAAAGRPVQARTKAGLGVLAVAAGAAAGGILGGPTGALLGLAGIGAARNLCRAQGIASADPAESGEAVRNLALGVVGLAGAGYLAYRLFFKDED